MDSSHFIMQSRPETVADVVTHAAPGRDQERAGAAGG
jgi:hypothetical protein